MTYTAEQLKGLSPEGIATKCSPVHVENVIKDLIATALDLMPEGYKLMPERPTEEMLKNAGKVKLFHDDGGKSDIGRAIAADVYREMIAYAPEKP